MGYKPIMITHRERTRSLDEWCALKGISKTTLYRRWVEGGKPTYITKHRGQTFFAKPKEKFSGRVEKLVLLLPDNAQMTYRQIAQLEGVEVKLSTIKAKAKKQDYIMHRDDLKVKGVGTSAVERATRLAANPEYLDPDYLPHIKFSDLAHLSDEENTGAGKGEIPDDLWIALMHGRRKSIASIGVQ
jgi:hypothetical protein